MTNGDFETHPAGTFLVLDEKIQKLRAALEIFANDTDDCVSPEMREIAREALKELLT